MARKRKKQKVIVFIEGSNIYFAQKKMGKWLDWVKVKRYLEKNYKIVEIRYYIGVRNRDPKMRRFLKKLRKIGFKVISKPVKKIIDETGRELEKANFDVEITGDVLETLEKLDTVLLFSGDSDFAYLCKLLHKKHKKVYFFASKKTLAWELRRTSDGFFYLEHLLHLTKGKEFVKL